jgi:hypothetical protein
MSHNKKIHGWKNIDIIRIIDASKSPALKISPWIMKRPFINNSPAENIISDVSGWMLKISIKNNIDDNKSIEPRILTSIII